MVPDFEAKMQYEVWRGLKTVVCFLARLKDVNKEVALSHEHSDFKWCSLEEAKALCGFPQMKDALDSCAKKIES